MQMTETVRIAIPDHASPVVRSAARLLARELGRRADLAAEVVALNGDADIVLGTAGAVGASADAKRLDELGPEGFLVIPENGRILVTSTGDRGVLYGVGRLLRETTVTGSWVAPREVIADSPALPVRCIYFADHMGNWYAHAPAEEVRELLEEMALWGYNEFMDVLDVRPGEIFFDSVARMRILGDHARSLGMTLSTVVQSNSSFNRPPEELKATPGPIPGAHDVCPTVDGGADFLVEDKKTYLPLMQAYDTLCLWPYDGGGCYGDECRPWAKTYLDLSARIAAEAIDGPEVRASAWFFERHMPGEDDALFDYLGQSPDWFRDIVAGADEVRRWLRDGRKVSSPYGVVLFPDIAMFDGIPWGGRGANPSPRRFAAELADAREVVTGAVVYSEGRYDDVNKVLWAQLLWNPERDPRDILRDYARWYLAPDVADEAAALMTDFDADADLLPEPERWRRGDFHADWDQRAARIEHALPADVAAAWRWQALRVKTRMEAASAVLHDADATAEAKSTARTGLRSAYALAHDEINLADPARSLPTWFTAPFEEAFPFAAQ